jgi:hypothetical protein
MLAMYLIAVLLFLIFCVLLFGAGAILTALGWLALITVGMLVAALAVFGGAAVIWLLVVASVNANSWLPNVPGLIARFFGSLGKVLALPVLAPINHWKSARKPNAAGDRPGVFVASLSTLWTLFVAVFLWYFVVLMLVLLVYYTYHLFAKDVAALPFR